METTHPGAVGFPLVLAPAPGASPEHGPGTVAGYAPRMPLPVLVVGDVQGDFERLGDTLAAYPESEVETIFLGDFFQGGRPGAGGGHRAARMAMERRNSRAILGNHDLFLLAILEEKRRDGPRRRVGSGELMETVWLSRRGDHADLDALAADPALDAWLRVLPLMLLLDDGTLVQHTDDDAYADLGASVEEVNATARRLLGEDPDGIMRVLRHVIGRHAFDDPERLDVYLRRFGARRLIHGHTPHWGSGPDVRQGGRVIGFDGRFSRFWSRQPGEDAGPAEATIALLPPL
jgi:hypothetical protein